MTPSIRSSFTAPQLTSHNRGQRSEVRALNKASVSAEKEMPLDQKHDTN